MQEILESHRISRTIKSIPKLPTTINQTSSSYSSEYQDLDENIQSARKLQDVLGPLPAIPNTSDSSNRWSFRRISGYSGIYEEILEPGRKDSE